MKRLLIAVVAILLFFSLGAECDDPVFSPVVPGEIVIRHSATTASEIGWRVAEPGHVYLIVSLDIENRGSESFSTSRIHFRATINQVEYRNAAVSIDGGLPSVDLLDGGRVSGKIVFEVPKQNGPVMYTLRYSHWRTYNITWVAE